MNAMPTVLMAVGMSCVLMAAAGVLVISLRGSLRTWPLWPLALFILSYYVASFTGCATQPVPQPIIVQQPVPAPIVKVEPPKPTDPRIGLSSVILTALDNPDHPDVRDGDTLYHSYQRNQQWSLTCTPNRATMIVLKDDEHFEQAAVGDTTRWSVQGSDHTVLVKPLGDPSDPKMVTNLTISTNKRVYALNPLRLGRFTPLVAWYYPDDYKMAMAAFKATSGTH